MHWRYRKADGSYSDKQFTFDDHRKYSNRYYNNYYSPDAPIMLKTFGICERSPTDHVINRYVDRYIFHFILAGKGWCNGIPFEEGDILFCTNATPHNISSDSSAPCTYAWVSFSGGKSEKYLAELGITTQPFLSYHTENMQRIAQILYNMMEVDHTDLNVPLFLEASLLQLLSLSSPPSNEGDSEPAKKEKRVSLAVEYIAENFRDPDLSLVSISKATGTNDKYLQRIFKKEMGITIYRYIAKLRMDAAITLLNTSNYNVNEISEFVGYNDRRTFTEAFKKQFGISPTKFETDS